MAAIRDRDLPSLSFLLVKGYPRAWQEFWETVHSLSRKFGIDLNAALEVFKLVYECVSKEEEGKPLSTGFLIGDVEKLMTRLQDDTGTCREGRSIFDLSKTVRTLFGLVDGYTSAFVVGKDGTFVDTRLMPNNPPQPGESSLTSVEFHGYCYALKETAGYALVASGSTKTAKLFHDGSLCAEVYFSGKTGQWTCRSLSDVSKTLDQVASRKGIAAKILYKIFSTAINMSNHREGGAMIVGNPEEILSQSETPRLMLGSKNVLELVGHQERHLYNLATREFALLISKEGELEASSVRLLARLPSGAKVELASTDGGRHRSAAEISASTNSVAFVVSDDGPITVYSEGKRTLRT